MVELRRPAMEGDTQHCVGLINMNQQNVVLGFSWHSPQYRRAFNYATTSSFYSFGCGDLCYSSRIGL